MACTCKLANNGVTVYKLQRVKVVAGSPAARTKTTRDDDDAPSVGAALAGPVQ